MRLVFMGTPEFSVPTLEALAVAGHDIVAVYTQPPRPAGRGKKERKSAVHIAAEKKGLPVLTPKSMKDAEAIEEFAALEVAAAVVVAYGQILPQAVLDAPKYGCINVHASLLPRWRGAAPIHRAILAGDKNTGVCIMQMEAGLDTGPVLARAEIPIEDSDTTLVLHDKLAALGGKLIGDVLTALEAGTVAPEAQHEEGVTYAKKIDKAEAQIDWRQDAGFVDRQVRAMCPFPGAWFMLNGDRIKILAGEIHTQKGAAGTVLDNRLIVACGDLSYWPTRVQKAGKAATDIADFLRGNPVPVGTELI